MCKNQYRKGQGLQFCSICEKSDLFFELSELFGQVLDQLVGGVELSLEVPIVALLPVPVLIGQRHGSHSGEPVQVLILTKRKYSHFSSDIVYEEAYLLTKDRIKNL